MGSQWVGHDWATNTHTTIWPQSARKIWVWGPGLPPLEAGPIQHQPMPDQATATVTKDVGLCILKCTVLQKKWVRGTYKKWCTPPLLKISSEKGPFCILPWEGRKTQEYFHQVLQELSLGRFLALQNSKRPMPFEFHLKTQKRLQEPLLAWQWKMIFIESWSLSKKQKIKPISATTQESVRAATSERTKRWVTKERKLHQAMYLLHLGGKLGFTVFA